MSFALKDIKYETRDFWVLDVGKKGFEVYRIGITHSTRVASIGRGEMMGLPRAIKEANDRQSVLNSQNESESCSSLLRLA